MSVEADPLDSSRSPLPPRVQTELNDSVRELMRARLRETMAAIVPAAREGIMAVEGDVLDRELPARVEELIPTGRRCLVIEDSAHVHETTLAALEGFTRFVGPGGFFVVEDGCVDIEDLRVDDDWPRGVTPAITEWLQTEAGRDFEVRRDLELYGISCHPGGFLRRRSSP